MMKFFRKHNKKILGVLMALLMVVFLGGTALESWLRPQRNEVIGQSKLGPITLVDQQLAKGTTDLLELVGFRWSQPVPTLTEPLTAVDWIMLTREADRLGTRRDAAAVRTVIGDKDLAERIDQVARRVRVRPERVVEAIGEFQTVLSTAGAIATASLPSESEVRGAARVALEKVKVRVVLLLAGMFTDHEKQFTEEQIRAHFEKYRDRPKGLGLDFGYRVPDSVQVQYIKIDRDRIAKLVGISNPEAKAKKYYEENRETNPLFRKMPDEIAAERPSPLAEDEPFDIPPFKDWEAAKEMAMHFVRNQHADEAAMKIADWLILDLTQPWLSAERGEDLYRKQPPGASDADVYAKALERIPRNLAYADAVSVNQTGFFSAEDADKQVELGAAYVPETRGRSFSIQELAFRTRGLVPRVPPTDKDLNAAEYLATFQTSNLPLQDSLGNVYIFRVIAARPAHSPETLEEVREKVVADLRQLDGFATAKARAEGLRSCAPDSGLQQAYESDEELVALKQKPARGWGSGFFDPPAVPRTYLSAAAKGQREASTFVQGGVGAVPAEVVDQWFELEFAGDKVAVFELPARSAVAVVEWVETQRPTSGEYTDNREKILQEMMTARYQAVMADWLTPERIRLRNQFGPAGGGLR